MRIVKYYNDPLHANIDREKLEAEGITAAVLNEHAGIVIPLQGAIPSLRPHLVVADEDYLAATEILDVRAIPLSEKVVCPNCGSDKVKLGFGEGTKLRKFLVKYVFFPIAAFTGTPVGGIRSNYYCRKCRCEFGE